MKPKHEAMHGIAWLIDSLGIKGAEIIEPPYSDYCDPFWIFFNSEEDKNLFTLTTLHALPNLDQLAVLTLKSNPLYAILELVKHKF